MTSYQLPKNSIVRASAVVAASLLWFAGCGFAGAAERPSEAQILNALRPAPLARSLSGAPEPS